MTDIKEYIDNMFRDMEDSDKKKQIIEEITQDLNDKVVDLMASGKSLEDATNKALVEFGDIDEIRKEIGSRTVKSTKKNYGLALSFSIWGSALIIAFFLFINFYYSPKVIWFVYPTFAVLWWPLSLYFVWLKHKKEM